MADRGKAMGMDRALHSKMAGKYDAGAELEVREWVKEVLGEDIGEGQYEVEKRLKDGILLIQLLQKIYENTSKLPGACNNIKLKYNTMSAPFKQMENIEVFLKGAMAYGVPEDSCFQTVDLFEGRNMPMVISTMLQVGTEAQRNGFNGSTCGAKPVEHNRREFEWETLRQGHSLIGLQAGTNKYDSQKGMTAMGAVRHISDIRADVFSKEAEGMLTPQLGTNWFASQKGMTAMGAVRHISDIRADQFDPAGAGIITLQAGTNKYASQKGMTAMGACRHVSDIRCDDADKAGDAVLGLQAGTNRFASQKGMTAMGACRHVSDIKVDEMSEEGKATLHLQVGTNRFASQKGMTAMGACRHVSDIKVTELAAPPAEHWHDRQHHDD